MSIRRLAHPICPLQRSGRLLRLAVAATVLALAGVIGTAHTAHADGPAALGAAGVATTATATEAEDSAVPNADTVVLAIDPAKWTSPRCTLRALVTYEGATKVGQPLSGYRVTFEAPDRTWLYGSADSDQNGVAVLSVPRPTNTSQTYVIRAALYDSTIPTPLVVSNNTVDCLSLESLIAAATASALGCEPINTPTPC
jgi:hypothetical protein